MSVFGDLFAIRIEYLDTIVAKFEGLLECFDRASTRFTVQVGDAILNDVDNG